MPGSSTEVRRDPDIGYFYHSKDHYFLTMYHKFELKENIVGVSFDKKGH